MSTFTTINDAINYLADLLACTTEQARWVYENTGCPDWDAEGFAEYDFLADAAIENMPS